MRQEGAASVAVASVNGNGRAFGSKLDAVEDTADSNLKALTSVSDLLDKGEIDIATANTLIRGIKAAAAHNATKLKVVIERRRAKI